jgi:Zn-dependent peptidase ImmA (M78 family)
MPRPKIDRVKLNQMLRDGKPQITIAQFFGVSEGAISKAKKELNIAVVKNTVLETAHQIVQKELDVVGQLYESNKRINEVAEDLMAKIRGQESLTKDVKGNKDIRIILKEFEEERRKQLTFQMEIFKTLTDYRVVAEFQKTVIEIIGNADKCPKCGEILYCMKCGQRVSLREKLISDLKEARALRASAQIRP